MNKITNQIPLQLSNGVVIVPIRHELTLPVLEYLKKDLLGYLETHSDASAVVFDLNGVKMIGALEFQYLKKLMKIVEMIGFSVVLCGLSPGVVSTIIDLSISMDGIATTLDLNSAYHFLNKSNA